MEEKINELNHVIETGDIKIKEFEREGHKLLDNINEKAETTFTRIEQRVEKVLNFFKWIATTLIVPMAVGLGSALLVLQSKASTEDVEAYYMTKEYAKKAFEIHEQRLNLLSNGKIMIPKDTVNYNWIIQTLFDTNTRGSHTK